MSTIIQPVVDGQNAEFSGSPAYCSLCRHFNLPERRCLAFPNGIPAEIFNGQADHRKPYDNDGGILYEPVYPGDEKYLDLIIEQNQGGE